MDKIHVGSKVRHNNLTCIVVSVEGKDCEIQPVGSRSRYTVHMNEVNLILNEGTNDVSVEEMLCD